MLKIVHAGSTWWAWALDTRLAAAPHQWQHQCQGWRRSGRSTARQPPPRWASSMRTSSRCRRAPAMPAACSACPTSSPCWRLPCAGTWYAVQALCWSCALTLHDCCSDHDLHLEQRARMLNAEIAWQCSSREVLCLRQGDDGASASHRTHRSSGSVDGHAGFRTGLEPISEGLFQVCRAKSEYVCPQSWSDVPARCSTVYPGI